MITFGGVSILTAVPGIRIVDVNIGAPALETGLRSQPIRFGSSFIRSRLGTRTVRLVVDLADAVVAVRETMRGQLMAWCISDEPKNLAFMNIPDKHLVAVCTSLPDFNVSRWWEDLQITFTAIDPYFISKTAKTGSVGTEIVIDGHGPAQLTIHQTIESQITAPRWVLDSGPSIILAGAIDSAELEIDIDARLVTINDTPAMEVVTLTSDFAGFAERLLPGPHTIAGENGAAGSISWYERWL